MSIIESSIDFRKSVEEVLEKEARGILELKKNIGTSINDAIYLILQCRGRVVLTGIGKSGIIGRKINATMASTGTPSFFLHPSEGLHGDLGMVTKDDVVIAISNSGETEEVLNLLPSIKKIGAKIISIVKNPISTLGLRSDVVLSIGNVEEACPLGLAPTTSAIVTLALGDALAIALQKANNFSPEEFAVYHPKGSLGKRMLLTVQDIITNTRRNPFTSGDISIKEALFLMTAQGLGAISVVNNNNELVGILTDGDIRRAFAVYDDLLVKTVDDICNTVPISIHKSLLASEAFVLMEERRINVLPVVDERNRPTGMISIHDLMSLGL